MVFKRSTDIEIFGFQFDLHRVSRRILTQKRSSEFLLWSAFATVLLVGYKCFSDGGFSAILTLSSLFQGFAFLLLLVKVLTQATCSGISESSLILHAIALVGRLASTLFYSGYLPVDKSGDWLYQTSDILSLTFAIAVVALMRSKRVSPTREADTITPLIPCIIAGILAMLVRPRLNNFALTDWSWTFGVYVEALCSIPQLLLMSKAKYLEAMNAHFIASIAISRFCSLLFWLYSSSELQPRRHRHKFNIAGYFVVGAFVLQVLLLVDFLLLYAKALKKRGTKMGSIQLDVDV